jgi:hypothetical protein
MTISADSAGVVRGKFTIPANIPAGSKRVAFTGAGGSYGEAIFSGQGTVEHQRWLQETEITTLRWVAPPPPVAQLPVQTDTHEPGDSHGAGYDPLAQTFTLDANTQLTGVDLWFTAKPTSVAKVQIRQTTNGFPDRRIIAEAPINLAAVLLGGAATRILFATPVLLLGGAEYAIVVLCDDAAGALSVAEIGKFDASAQRWITSQPYNVGVLLSSSNASTWTAHQDRDLTFSLLAADFSEAQHTVNLGAVSVTGATDLMLMSYAERPAGNTDVQYQMTLPDSTVITLADGQPIQLAAPVTGSIGLQAVLKGGDLSPVLHPGAQLVAGAIATTADYVTRAIPGGTGVSVKVVYEALVPSGATVTVQYKGPDAGDVWTTIGAPTTRAVDGGFVEFTHVATGVTEASVQIKLILSGTTSARPRVRDLRTFVL